MQNDSIITSNVGELTLTSKFIKIESSKGEFVIDIQKMMKEPVNSDNAYFNATRVAEYFPNKKLAFFQRLESTKEYIKVLEDEFLDYANLAQSKPIKTHYTKRGKETPLNKGTFGTYLHNELFLKYLSWCDVKFEREIHRIIKHVIINANELKIERGNARFHFKPLTDVIKDIYIPAQTSDNSKKFAYSSLSNLINIAVLGASAKKYISDNNLDTEKALRDQLSKKQVTKIDKLEIDLHGYIKYGKVYEYQELKELLK